MDVKVLHMPFLFKLLYLMPCAYLMTIPNDKNNDEQATVSLIESTIRRRRISYFFAMLKNSTINRCHKIAVAWRNAGKRGLLMRNSKKVLLL